MATQPDHVNSGAIATMFALTALATVAAALGITALVRSEQGELGSVRDEPISRAYRSLRAEQETSLKAPPAWVDREKGLVSLPIDKAMELTLQDIRRGRTVVGARKPDDTAPEDAVTPEGGADSQELEGTPPGQEGQGAAPTETGPGSTTPQPGKTQGQPTGPQGSTQPQGSPGGTAAPGQDSRGAGAQGQGVRSPSAGTPSSTGAQGAGQMPAGTPSGTQEGPGR